MSSFALSTGTDGVRPGAVCLGDDTCFDDVIGTLVGAPEQLPPGIDGLILTCLCGFQARRVCGIRLIESSGLISAIVSQSAGAHLTTASSWRPSRMRQIRKLVS